tara:strand:- start:72 stop:908 length:837 start_codon:yes stop_codon:yes gene_type:complete
MKKIILILLLPLFAFSQNDCGERPVKPKKNPNQTKEEYKNSAAYLSYKKILKDWKYCISPLGISERTDDRLEEKSLKKNEQIINSDTNPSSKSKNSIKNFVEIEQPLYENINIGIGSVMIRINKKRSLKNAFGRADIFGRTTDLGYVELTYGGMGQNGNFLVVRKEMKIETNETSMTRTKMTFGNSFGNVSGSSRKLGSSTKLNNTTTGFGTTTTGFGTFSGNSMGFSSGDDYHIPIKEGDIPIELTPSDTIFPIENFIIKIRNVSKLSIDYIIEEKN